MKPGWFLAGILVAAAAFAQNAADPSGALAGRVINAQTGEPVRRANVILNIVSVVGTPPPGGPRKLSAVTGSDGRFRIEPLTPGAYTVSAERTGFITGSPFGSGRSNMRTPVQIRDGESTEVEVALQPTAVITGRVLDEDGEPALRAQVTLMRRQYINGAWRMSGASSATTDDMGEYRLAFLYPGRYWVAASLRTQPQRPAEGPVEIYANTYYPQARQPAEAIPLDLTPGAELRGIDIRLIKTTAVTVRGRITGTEAERVSVSLRPSDQTDPGSGSNHMYGITPDGRFVFPQVIPGSYQLTLHSPPGPRRYLGWTEVEIGDGGADNLEIRPFSLGTVRGRYRIEGPPPANAPAGARVQVRIQGQASSPPAPFTWRVRLVPMEEPREMLNPVEVGDSGDFQVESVPPGRYAVVTMGGPPGTYLKALLANGEDCLHTGFRVAEGATVAIELVFARDIAMARGKVLDADGQPMPGAMVSFIPVDYRGPEWDQPAGPRSLMAQTSGRFQVFGLAPGEYIVQAWEEIDSGAWFDPELRKRTERFASRVTLKPGENPEVVLTATPAALVRGY